MPFSLPRRDGRIYGFFASDVDGFEPGSGTIVDLRGVADHNDKDLTFVKSLGKIFYYDALSVLADNGTTVLQPDDVLAGQPGRWLEVPGGGGAGPVPQQIEEEITPTAGQVSFTLSWPPVSGPAVDFLVNGVDYEQDVDFSVSGQNLTWLNVPFSLEPGDHVTIRYWM